LHSVAKVTSAASARNFMAKKKRLLILLITQFSAAHIGRSDRELRKNGGSVHTQQKPFFRGIVLGFMRMRYTVRFE